MRGIKYNFIEKNKCGIFYSYIHLKLLLDKYKYKNPFYSKEDSKILYPLTNIEKIADIKFAKGIIVYEGKDIKSEITKIYEELLKQNREMFSHDEDVDINKLSPNFLYYFIKGNDNLNIKKIPIYLSTKRNRIAMDIFNFSDNETQRIHALCGPFGIGKSFTALLIQKYLFFQ